MSLMITPNNPAAISLAGGQSLVVKDMSGASALSPATIAREDASVRIGAGFFVYGPATTDGSFTLSTTGQSFYNIVQGDPTPANGRLSYDPGNPPISGPSLSGLSASAVAAQALSPRARGAVLLGDSRNAAESLDADSPTTGSHYNYGRGVFTLSNALADQRMILVKNAGVGGNTLADLLARYPTDVKPFAASAKYLIIWCDLNDINAGVDLATMRARSDQLYQMAVADGFTVIEYLGYAPGANAVTGVGWTVGKTQQLIQYNTWRKEQQGLRQNYVTMDVWAALVTASANPAVTPDAMLWDPATTAFHIGVAGAMTAANLLAAIWRANVPPVPLLTASTVDNYAADPTNNNLFDRGMFLGVAGTLGTGAANEGTLDAGFAAGVANGLTVQRNNGGGTVNCSTGPASDGVGNAQRLRIAGTTIAGETYSMVLTAKPLARAVPGASYEARARIVIESPVRLHAAYVRASATFTSAGQVKTIQCRSIAESTPTTGAYPGNVTLTHRTPRLDLPADATNITVFEPVVIIIFDDNVGGGSAKISIERMSFNRIV